jgi:hypothetical protein
MKSWCPECGRYSELVTECDAERFRWDEDDAGHHCAERGLHEVHRCREHGCLWTDATAQPLVAKGSSVASPSVTE